MGQAFPWDFVTFPLGLALFFSGYSSKILKSKGLDYSVSLSLGAVRVTARAASRLNTFAARLLLLGRRWLSSAMAQGPTSCGSLKAMDEKTTCCSITRPIARRWRTAWLSEQRKRTPSDRIF
ncbi:uroporphyrinogen decarboxylase [Striga asiatica]|uniref:Uroporphyrinogen decarboxylase n=1 Tax=Striga asiatica TaxID=4170 RepID=A0A5A7RDM1_STRAF|nr:uroporphyrinogen decarboxylase [Striga asiatica]